MRTLLVDSRSPAVALADVVTESWSSPKNLAAAGDGELDPVADNKAVAGREQNRRIEIILVPDLAELPTLTGNSP